MKARVAACILLCVLSVCCAEDDDPWAIGGVNTPVHSGRSVNTGADELTVVHLIPHSHDDAGWIKTFREYYDEDVERIITGTFTAISANSSDTRATKRTFHQVEIAFLSEWFTQQSANVQEQYRALLVKRMDDNTLLIPLNILSGGWVMHDEAVTTYTAIIDQMTLGHQWILEHLGPNAIPKYGWQIDPFGASASTPQLYASMCFDATFYMRMNQKINAQMKKDKTLEFMWFGLKNPFTQKNTLLSTELISESSESSLLPLLPLLSATDPGIFMHILESHYCSPRSFDFEHNNDTKKPNKNPQISENNINERANTLIRDLNGRAEKFMTKNILVPFGCDFSFTQAKLMYENMDHLINYINENNQTYKIFIQYSTIETYLNAVRDEQLAHQIEFTSRYGDFLPYADGENQWWTGFYTSRPALKGLSRVAESVLRHVELLMTIYNTTYKPLASSSPPSSDEFPLDWSNVLSRVHMLRSDNGIVQHHDAITGTSKQHVYEDYMARLTHSIPVALTVATDIVSQLFHSPNDNINNQPKYFTTFGTVSASDELLSVLTSLSSSSSSSALHLILYSSLSHVYERVFTMIAPHCDYRIRDANDQEVDVQANPFLHAEHFDPYVFMPKHDDRQLCSLSFITLIPPLGWRTFIIQSSKDQEHRNTLIAVDDDWKPITVDNSIALDTNTDSKKESVVDSTFIIENNRYCLTFNRSTGGLFSIENKVNNMRTLLRHVWVQYRSETQPPQASGAYVFRPSHSHHHAEKIDIEQSSHAAYKVEFGRHYSHVIQRWSSRLTMTIRLYHYTTNNDDDTISNGGDIQVSYNIGAPDENRELVSRWVSDVNNDRLLWHDENGLRLMRRDLSESDRVGGSYYPMVTSAFIRDTNGTRQLAFVSDRTHGVSSPTPGVIDIMLHRRCSQDDGKGMREAMNDTASISPHFRLMLNTPQSAMMQMLHASKELAYPILPFYSQPQTVNTHYSLIQRSFLTDKLPRTIEVMTLTTQNTAGMILLRLHHLLDPLVTPMIGKREYIDLNQIFRGFTVMKWEETKLTGAKLISECERTDWMYFNDTTQTTSSTSSSNRTAMSPPSSSTEAEAASSSSGSSIISLWPSQFRTFRVILQANNHIQSSIIHTQPILPRYHHEIRKRPPYSYITSVLEFWITLFIFIIIVIFFIYLFICWTRYCDDRSSHYYRPIEMNSTTSWSDDELHADDDGGNDDMFERTNHSIVWIFRQRWRAIKIYLRQRISNWMSSTPY